MVTIQDRNEKEKYLLLEYTKDSLGYYDTWHGCPKCAKVIDKYGDYKLKYGWLVTGTYMRKTDLKNAIQNVKKAMRIDTSVRYRKKNYSIPEQCKKVLTVLNNVLEWLNSSETKGSEDGWLSFGKSDKDDNGHLANNVNGWILPIVKSRRKSNNIPKAKEYLEEAQRSWIDTTDQCDDTRHVFFTNSDGSHELSPDEIDHLLTRGEPW